MSRKAVSLIRTRADKLSTRKEPSVLGVGDFGVRQGLAGADELVGEDDVDGVAGPGVGAVEEEFDTGRVAMPEAGGLQCRADSREIVATDEDLYVAWCFGPPIRPPG